MEKFSEKDRAFCVKAYLENHKSAVISRRIFMKERGLKKLDQCPSKFQIKRWVGNFSAVGSTYRNKNKSRNKSVMTTEAAAAIDAVVKENPRISVRRLSAVTGIKKSTAHKILRTDLRLYPYKIQMVHGLQPKDYQSRLNFVTEVTRVRNFKNVLFSDEAHFYLNGVLNKQNCRIWSSENPQSTTETTLHPAKVTVWAGLASWGLVGPFFFEDHRGQALTVNSDRYDRMLTEKLTPALKNQKGANSRTWFQQDGATCHTTDRCMGTLKKIFGNRIISRRGTINWPPRSPDLSPLDFYLWGFLKDRVYNNKPSTIAELKSNIISEMEKITTDTLGRVISNFEKRLEQCREKKGGYLDDIIFKK